MAYLLATLQTDIRNYTEVDSGVLTDAIVNTFIVNAENKIYRPILETILKLIVEY